MALIPLIMSNYIISKYCIPFLSPDKEAYFYLSKNNSLHKVSHIFFDSVCECKKKPSLINHIPENIFQKLKADNIITTVEEEENYYRKIKMDYFMEVFSPQKLILTIAPTSDCNFNCPYCFEENKKPIRMSDAVIENIILFIKRYKHLELLYITWYGGEPLMAIDIIKKILNRINTEIPNIKIYHHFLVTNGYFINERMLSLFSKYPLNSIQITLDGNKTRHDNLRKLKLNGTGTFDKIVNNIEHILKNMPNTQISVRVNLDKDNVGDFKRIREELLEKWKSYDNITIYPGILRIEDPVNKCMGCQSLLHDDVRELFYGLGENVNFYPVLQGKGCSATHLNSFLIGPSGELYKCWNELGDEKKIIGFINDKDFKNKDLIRKYVLSANCFEDEKCKNCEFIPICVGGCAFYRIKNMFDNGNFDICSLYKDDGVIEKCICMHLDKLRRQIDSK